MQFNWKLILQPNTVVHCDTEEKAITLLAEAHERGLRWSNDRSYVNCNQWGIFKNKTCYKFTTGSFCDVDYYKDNHDELEYLEERNYTILTYEDVLIKGENEMKRIDISKVYKDGEISVIKFRDIMLFRLKSDDNYNKLVVGVGTNALTITQANTILAPFGYELYESTDWTKVEVGIGVRKTSVRMGEGFAIRTFYQYIPNTSQILVIENGYVKVYNEGEVELL
jgi:hypothetical protein